MARLNPHLYTRTEPVLLPYFPRLVYLSLLDQGYGEERLFRGLDFSAEQLHDEKYRLSIEQHERFIVRALEIANDPHYAIQLGRKQHHSNANLALMAVANSGRISRALHLITRYNSILTRVFSVQFNVSDEDAYMDIDAHLEHHSVIYFAVSAFALFLDNFFLEALKGGHLVGRTELAISEPGGFDQVRDEFPFAVAFDQPGTRLYFNKEFLDAPMTQADPQTVRLLQEMCEKQLEQAEAEMSLVGAIKTLLIEQIASPPKLDETAKRVGMSPRGLRRKLAQSGTSYQKLLDSIRSKIATRLLRDTGEPVSSIAYELGFENPSDFGRAFKKWTGQSPSSIRQDHT